MKSFDRAPLAYWSDRAGILVLLGGMGGLSLAASGDDVPVLVPIVGIFSIALGIWAFMRPFPTRIEIDDTEIRVLHRPAKVVRIPRDASVRAVANAHQRGVVYGIAYVENGKAKAARIGFGYRGEDGKSYPRGEIVKAINITLGILK